MIKVHNTFTIQIIVLVIEYFWPLMKQSWSYHSYNTIVRYLMSYTCNSSFWNFPFPLVAISHTELLKSYFGFILTVFYSSDFVSHFFPYPWTYTLKVIFVLILSILFLPVSFLLPVIDPTLSSYAFKCIKWALKLFLFWLFYLAFTLKIKAINPMSISCGALLSLHLLK